MIRLDKSHVETGHQETASVSNPGVVRNFRVQVRESDSSDWHMYSTFRHRREAESCIAALQLGGVSARLVDCDRCPTAI
ncbi:MAG: hypothetical protein O3C40_21355 [Planctomycetota bacterium]|nr:hypothetical protein [Planctomycetota bacterium]